MILITDATQDYVLTSRGSRAMPIDRTPSSQMETGDFVEETATVTNQEVEQSKPADGSIRISRACLTSDGLAQA